MVIRKSVRNTSTRFSVAIVSFFVLYCIASEAALSQEWQRHIMPDIFGYDIVELISAKNKMAVLSLKITDDAQGHYLRSGVNVYDSKSKSWTHITSSLYGFSISDTVHLNDIAYDKTGNLWVAADKALYRFDGNSWQKITMKDSLEPYRDFKKIACDSIGNIWFLSKCFITEKVEAGGAIYGRGYDECLRFDGKEFKTVLWGSMVEKRFFWGFQEIAASPDGVVWVMATSTPDKKDLVTIDAVNATELKSYAIDTYLPKEVDESAYFNRIVTHMVPGINNTLWISYSAFVQNSPNTVYNGEIAYFDGNSESWIHSDTMERVSNFIVEENHVLWYGLESGGVYEIVDNKKNYTSFAKIFKPDDPFPQYVSVDKIKKMVLTENGELWVGTLDGIISQKQTTSVTEDLLKDDRISLFPVPVKNGENVKILMSVDKDSYVFGSIFNLLGEKIKEINPQEITHEHAEIIVPMQGIELGVYMVKLNIDGITYTRKFIVSE